MSEERQPAGLGRAMLYLSVPFDILAGALIGYYVAKDLGFTPELGVALGAILGTLLMWFTVYREVRRGQRHAKASKV